METGKTTYYYLSKQALKMRWGITGNLTAIHLQVVRQKQLSALVMHHLLLGIIPESAYVSQDHGAEKIPQLWTYHQNRVKVEVPGTSLGGWLQAIIPHLGASNRKWIALGSFKSLPH
jgi:hypothetical protein